MRLALAFGLAGALLAASCEQTIEVESGPTADPELLLPQPDASGSYFLWTPEEQLVGYRNIEKIFDSHTVKASGTPHGLPEAHRDLNISYDVDGETWTEETYMERTNVVGLLVIHGGTIILERYRHDYGPGERWVSFSVAKSITSTLVGTALGDGAIESLDDPHQPGARLGGRHPERMADGAVRSRAAATVRAGGGGGGPRLSRREHAILRGD